MNTLLTFQFSKPSLSERDGSPPSFPMHKKNPFPDARRTFSRGENPFCILDSEVLCISYATYPKWILHIRHEDNFFSK